jgi:GT2 family glycosyltransferase
MEPDVTLVLPTHDRAAALRQTLAPLLALAGVREVVVVDDGSRDATPALLADVRDPRLRVLRRPRRHGAPAARNLGARAATSPWVLFGEDDCFFPPDYAQVLREEADAHAADVVGAPMVHVRAGEDLATATARVRALGRGDGGLDDVAGFPPAALETPLLPATALVRRDLVTRLGFDEGFGGTGYREETDFFLRAAAAGARLVLTQRTCFSEQARWGGGQARGQLATEYWALRNNARFLRRHGRTLAARGLIASPLREQAAFTRRRAARWLGSR